LEILTKDPFHWLKKRQPEGNLTPVWGPLGAVGLAGSDLQARKQYQQAQLSVGQNEVVLSNSPKEGNEFMAMVTMNQ